VGVRVCVRPSSHTEYHLQIPVRRLENLQLLDTAVDIVALVVPGIVGVVLVRVGVGVCQEDCAVGFVVGERV
jgi:hypothetical protein